MKHYKLLMASLLLAIGGGSAVAQTWEDYTSKIANPSFENDEAKTDLKNSGWGEKVSGWTIIPSTDPKNSQEGTANANTTIQGIGSTFLPSAGDKFFYLRCNWNDNTEFKVSQKLSGDLPVGTYKLTCKVAIFSSQPTKTNYRLSLGDGTNTATNNFSYDEKKWGDWSIIFYKSDASTDLTIEAYMKPGAKNSNQHYCMLLDDFKLEYLSDDELAKASSENPLDLTAAISNPKIYNPGNYDTKEKKFKPTFLPKGWSENRKAAGNDNRTEKIGDSQLEGWSAGNLNVKYYQTLTNLPAGKYVLKANVHDSNEKGAVLYASSGTVTQTVKMGKDYTVLETPIVSVINGNLEIGIDAPNLAGGTWMTGDDFAIYYVDSYLSVLKTTFDSKKAEAKALLENADYKNIEGLENTELENAMNQNPEETKSALEVAIKKLESAMSVFISAKSAYDNYAEEAVVAKKFGITVETPNTAAAATEALKTLNVAEYKAATSDYTGAIKLGEWTTTGASIFSNQHWSGETRSYLNQDDSNNHGWNSNNWTMTCTQTLTLPAGEYVFKAAGRKSANAFMKLSVNNGETLLGEVSNFPNGNVGLGITTDGKASFDSNDNFANNNKGRGWQWRFVPFTLETETEISFDIEAGANEIHNWASFGDYTVMAKPSVATSTAAYNQAVEEANKALDVEANKVVTGEELAKLNDALAADKGTTMESIDAATKNIQECTTAFTAAQPKYQALVDAKALEQTILAYASEEKYAAFTASKEVTATTATDAETMANAIISARRAYVESNGMAEGVNGAVDCTDKVVNPKFTASDGKASLGTEWNRSQTGGNEGAKDDEIWTNADGNKVGHYYDYWNGRANNQHVSQEVTNLTAGKYIVTIKARAQEGFNLYLLTNNEKKVDVNEIGSTGGVFERGWNDYTAEFTVGTDGKVKIEVANMPSSNQAGWFSFGDVRLVRLGDFDKVTLEETLDNAIEPKVADVTLKRTLKAEKWNTLVLPFAVSADKVKAQFGDGVEVAEYSNTDGEEINFSSTEDIKANVPVLIKPTTVSAENSYTFDGVTLVAGEPKTTGVSYDFVGSYKPYNLATDNYMLYNNQWWKNEEGDNYKVNAFSAYVQATTPEAAKQLTLVIDGQTTGLKLNTVTGNIEGETYNMAGQRVANSYKGLVIKNGKKIIKK